MKPFLPMSRMLAFALVLKPLPFGTSARASASTSTQPKTLAVSWRGKDHRPNFLQYGMVD